MASVDVKTQAGGSAGSVELDDAIFGIEPNQAVMHQVVTAQLAGRRRGTASTKTRREVRGGGAKPWRQKGTGRARQGSIRAPHWVGGGVAHGPKPRSYAQKTPKKMKKLALASALSDRAASNAIIVIDSWNIDAPSTKAAKQALADLGATGKALIVLEPTEVAVAKSFRNLPDAKAVAIGELTSYDVLESDVVIFTKASLPRSAAPAAEKAAEKTAEPAAEAPAPDADPSAPEPASEGDE